MPNQPAHVSKTHQAIRRHPEGAARSDVTNPRSCPMPYIDGFVAAVPKANKQAYIDHAREAAKFFRQWGATRIVENWGDDIPAGETTDFMRAVAAKDDEVVVFSWVEYPDKATRDAAGQKMMNDPEMAKMVMPFDGARLIYGGFETLFIE
jgi:uncharacterized protein YbaA (DUF1428 family)